MHLSHHPLHHAFDEFYHAPSFFCKHHWKTERRLGTRLANHLMNINFGATSFIHLLKNFCNDSLCRGNSSFNLWPCRISMLGILHCALTWGKIGRVYIYRKKAAPQPVEIQQLSHMLDTCYQGNKHNYIIMSGIIYLVSNFHSGMVPSPKGLPPWGNVVRK